MAVLPSLESATDQPCWARPVGPVPTSFACSNQLAPERTNTQAAPVAPLSSGPPTMAVLPSADMHTEAPCSAAPTAPEPTSFTCWTQVEPARRYIHAAPVEPASSAPPTIATLPSNDSETASP